jgi:signal transduction histidine kinase
MGGDITVDSAPGMGARFVFTLPYREAGAGFGA